LRPLDTVSDSVASTMANDKDAANIESLKQTIERRLAERASQDSAFIIEMMLHPDGVIKPLITEVLGDDGEINLDDVNTSVHVETGRNLHFVVTVPSGDVEGYGFDLASALGSFGSPVDSDLQAAGRRKTRRPGCPEPVTSGPDPSPNTVTCTATPL
jgi:hypothetical protein